MGAGPKENLSQHSIDKLAKLAYALMGRNYRENMGA
jgi:hypothetical protein